MENKDRTYRRAASAAGFDGRGDLDFAAIVDEAGERVVAINGAESPLAWLRRRKGPNGAPLISDIQFAAGERLREELTRSQMLPRVTASWSIVDGRRSGGPADPTDAAITARQRVNQALRAVGPDFAGLLMDVCGFLKGLSEVERERGWPARSAKLVLDMALTRLALHYGLAGEARGPQRSGGIRGWSATMEAA